MVLKNDQTKVVKNGVSFLEQQNIVHALTYFPFFIGAVSMFFLGKTNKEALIHHVHYSAIMSAAVMILLFILNGFFAGIVLLLYWVLSIYFAFNAYKGKAIEVEFLDVIEDKISEIFKK